ncbi:hypothetical protein [Haloarchaeobius amylolyticus]|uniref:hypothetical protein n=1 Tax=Haloarchaeobius amylolyticus TaxID=1198296 RepID=UPI0022720366|nr:hypothetical protein [Haloarchaeobius amylolyticus]
MPPSQCPDCDGDLVDGRAGTGTKELVVKPEDADGGFLGVGGWETVSAKICTECGRVLLYAED